MKDKKEKALIILSFAGLVFSFILLLIDSNPKGGAANLCSITSYVNCAKVAESAWSHIGPLPVALIGMFFYFFVAFYGFLTPKKETFTLFVSWLFLLASVYSLFLVIISITQIKAFCIFCAATYLVNWIGLWMVKGDLKFNFAILFEKANVKQGLLALAFSVAAVLLVFFLLGGKQTETAGKHEHQHNSMELIERYKSSYEYKPNTMFAPYIGGDNAKVEIIVFSDFHCHFCRDFLRNLHQLMQDKKYFDAVRVYYKAYPLDQECNQYMSRTLYPGSCTLAYAAYELMKKGLFWEFEKRVSEMPETNVQVGMLMANDLNKEKMNLAKIKEENQRYITLSVDEARTFGVQATPTWFINGRKFDGFYQPNDVKMLIDHILAENK